MNMNALPNLIKKKDKPRFERTMLVDHSYTDYSLLSEKTLIKMMNEAEEDILSGGSAAFLQRNGNGDDGRDRAENENEAEEISMEDRQKKEETEELKHKLRVMFGKLGPVRKNSGGVVQPFPEKLMEVLSHPDTQSIVSFLPHGRSFIVHRAKAFVQEVLPRFFKQSKFMSFTRQLNLWGFKRITKGVDAGAYYHELFLRGRPRLAVRMRRQKIKGTGIKLTPNPECEPDFYDMAKKRPLPQLKEPESAVKPLPPLPSSVDEENEEAVRKMVNGGTMFSATPQESSRLHSRKPNSTPSFSAADMSSGHLNARARMEMARMAARGKKIEDARMGKKVSRAPSHMMRCHVPNRTRDPGLETLGTGQHFLRDQTSESDRALGAMYYLRGLSHDPAGPEAQYQQMIERQRVTTLLREQHREQQDAALVTAMHQQLEQQRQKEHTLQSIMSRLTNPIAGGPSEAQFMANASRNGVSGRPSESHLNSQPNLSASSVMELKHQLLATARALQQQAESLTEAAVGPLDHVAALQSGALNAAAARSTQLDNFGGMLNTSSINSQPNTNPSDLVSLSSALQDRQLGNALPYNASQASNVSSYGVPSVDPIQSRRRRHSAHVLNNQRSFIPGQQRKASKLASATSDEVVSDELERNFHASEEDVVSFMNSMRR